jgi:hypothetical protein
MRNPLTLVPLTDHDKTALAALQANEGFKVLMACLKAELDYYLLNGSYVRVDTPTPNGKDEAEGFFQSAVQYKATIETIENTIKTPRAKEIKYAS